MAALVAAFSLFCLTLPASAYQGSNGGFASANWSDANPPIGYAVSVDNFAWRVDLYVSCNADGKINTNTDSIDYNLWPMGSLLCTTERFTSSSSTTYIQTNYTNETRNKFNSTGRTTSNSDGDIGGIQYTLPTLTEFDPAAGIYTSYTPNGTKHTVAIADAGSVHLFNRQYNTPTDFQDVQDGITKDKDTANGYVAEIIKQIILKSYGNDIGAFARDIAQVTGKPIREKLIEVMSQNMDENGRVKTEALIPYVLPTSPECLVEWAIVVTPMIQFYTDTLFYCSKDSAASLKHDGCELPYVSNGEFVML